MAKAVTFTARKFETATVAFIAACGNIDKAAADNSKAINGWAAMAAAGIAANAITLDTVKEGLIARFPKAETLGDCGNTVKGRFYALQRVIRGNAAERLIAGEALNTVARDTAPVQEQAKGKRSSKPSKGKAKPRAVTLETALEAVNSWLDAALAGDIEMARGLAANADLALVIAKCGKLPAILQAAAKADAAAKAAAKAEGKAVKASQAANRKAAKAAKAAAKPAKATPRPKGKARVTVKLLKAA